MTMVFQSGALFDSLSVGKRPVSVMRAAVLYDEPTTDLGPLTARSVAGLLRNLKHDLQLTSVVVTHDLKWVESIADRVIFLDEGKVIVSGTKEEKKCINRRYHSFGNSWSSTWLI